MNGSETEVLAPLLWHPPMIPFRRSFLGQRNQTGLGCEGAQQRGPSSNVGHLYALYKWWRRRAGLTLMILLIARALSAQTTTLALSSAETASGEVAILELSLSAVDLRPSAIQWTFHYSASNVNRVTIEDGPTLAAVGKTVVCSGDAAAMKCLMVGLNQETISAGVIARVTVMLASGAHSATILVSDAAGASRDGEPIPISPTPGTIRAMDSPSGGRSRPR